MVVESHICPPVRRNKANQCMGGRAVGGGEWGGGEGGGQMARYFFLESRLRIKHHNGKHGHLLPLTDSGPRIPNQKKKINGAFHQNL